MQEDSVIYDSKRQDYPEVIMILTVNKYTHWTFYKVEWQYQFYLYIGRLIICQLNVLKTESKSIKNHCTFTMP